MPFKFLCGSFLILALICSYGCSSWQPTKNVWKSTRGLWNTYVSPPASVDYDDKGSLSPEAQALSRAMVGIDSELGKLERTMQNADRPPTQEWLTRLFAEFPWLNGFAGVKYDGTILGQEPPDSIKQLDFIPLLYEDSKQHSHAIRGDVQPSPLGPEVMLAAPLYDGTDFLGIVAAYFDMRSLMHFSSSANDIVVLTPQALLWPGKYDYAATPLAGTNWQQVVRESTAGVCSNSTGSFYYVVRYLGNLPIIFALPKSGNFPEGSGSLEQAAAFFPQEREKLPPPTLPERKNKSETGVPAFEKPEPEEPEPVAPAQAQAMPQPSNRNVIPQGSRESVLLKRGKAKRQRQVEERALDGENVEYKRPEKPAEPPLELIPNQEVPRLADGRPSPFGRQQEEEREQEYRRPSPFGPGANQPEATNKETPAPKPSTNTAMEPAAQGNATATRQKESSEAAPGQPETGARPDRDARPGENAAGQPAGPGRPATLPGGRPSPFGPRN